MARGPEDFNFKTAEQPNSEIPPESQVSEEYLKEQLDITTGLGEHAAVEAEHASSIQAASAEQPAGNDVLEPSFPIDPELLNDLDFMRDNPNYGKVFRVSKEELAYRHRPEVMEALRWVERGRRERGLHDDDPGKSIIGSVISRVWRGLKGIGSRLFNG